MTKLREVVISLLCLASLGYGLGSSKLTADDSIEIPVLSPNVWQMITQMAEPSNKQLLALYASGANVVPTIASRVKSWFGPVELSKMIASEIYFPSHHDRILSKHFSALDKAWTQLNPTIAEFTEAENFYLIGVDPSNPYKALFVKWSPDSNELYLADLENAEKTLLMRTSLFEVGQSILSESIGGAKFTGKTPGSLLVWTNFPSRFHHLDINDENPSSTELYANNDENRSKIDYLTLSYDEKSLIYLETIQSQAIQEERNTFLKSYHFDEEEARLLSPTDLQNTPFRTGKNDEYLVWHGSEELSVFHLPTQSMSFVIKISGHGGLKKLIPDPKNSEHVLLFTELGKVFKYDVTSGEELYSIYLGWECGRYLASRKFKQTPLINHKGDIVLSCSADKVTIFNPSGPNIEKIIKVPPFSKIINLPGDHGSIVSVSPHYQKSELDAKDQDHGLLLYNKNHNYPVKLASNMYEDSISLCSGRIVTLADEERLYQVPYPHPWDPNRMLTLGQKKLFDWDVNLGCVRNFMSFDSTIERVSLQYHPTNPGMVFLFGSKSNELGSYTKFIQVLDFWKTAKNQLRNENRHFIPRY